jgi:glutathionylspermidine synthase
MSAVPAPVPRRQLRSTIARTARAKAAGSVRAERTAPAADAVAFWESYEGHPYALPDVVVLDAVEVDAIRAAARDAWSVYLRVAPLLHALPDEGLYALGIPAAACEVVRLRDERAGETLVARFDFLREGGRYRVLELNAETPFFLVESFVESGRRARAAGLNDPNADEFDRLGDAFAVALAPLAPGARIGVVATNVYREDVGTAYALRDLIAARVAAEVAFVPIHELAVVDGEVFDEHGPLDVLYRCYPLEHLATDPDGPALFDAVARGACRLLNPPSALLLQSKATQALIWGLYERGELFDARERDAIARLFLPTYLDRPDDGETYVRKPVLGREGLGVAILDPAGAEIAHGELGAPEYDLQPMVFQRYAQAPRRRVRRADGVEVDGLELTTCFVVGGEPSAIGMRIGGPVTDTRSHFAPLGVR